MAWQFRLFLIVPLVVLAGRAIVSRDPRWKRVGASLPPGKHTHLHAECGRRAQARRPSPYPQFVLLRCRFEYAMLRLPSATPLWRMPGGRIVGLQE